MGEHLQEAMMLLKFYSLSNYKTNLID